MSDSLRKQIRLGLADRLSEILQTNGYHSDAGNQISQGAGRVGPDDKVPTLVIAFGESSLLQAMLDGSQLMLLPFTVAGVLDADQADDLILEDLLGDVFRALFLEGDRKLGGLVQAVKHSGDAPLEREDGSTLVGVVLAGTIEYSERYGNPDAEAAAP